MFRQVVTGLDRSERMSGGEGALDTPGGPLNDSGGGGDFESADKYAVCFLDFFDNNNTVEKHLFFLIQSIYFS